MVAKSHFSHHFFAQYWTYKTNQTNKYIKIPLIF